MKTPAILLTLATCLLSLPLLSMPTPQEIAAAEPLVQEVMKSEMEALRLNKKTRAQVGAAAFALAKEAQAPAEKYLLLTGAFEQSLRGGAYDEALAALDELKRAIPDFPEKDEFALLDKAVRSISSSKGDALRERHATLAKRINNRARLEKLLEQSKKAPADKPLHFRVATYRVYFDDWASALDEFELSDNASCAAAAKAEKDASTPRSKVADLWWDATPLKPDFLTTALRAHSVSLYRTALSDNTLSGLQRIAAEKRVKEYESELAAASAPAPQSSSMGSKRNPYVTKGLVAMWDGEWNVGIGQHDGNARVWKDLIGKSDGKPFGATRFSDKSVLLDGNSFWEISPSSELFNVLLNPSVTCEVVLRFGKGAIVKNEGIIGFGKSSSRVLWGYAWGGPMGPDASIVFQHKGSPISQYWRAKGSFDGLHTMAISASNGDVFGWIDAKVCVKTKSAGANNPTPCYIGYIDGWAKMIGEIYCVRIYDHALDARELLSNHTVDIKRFRDGK